MMLSHNQWLSIIFFPPPANSSWRCKATLGTHCYCLQFGPRADTSYHVWGMSEVGNGKVRWRTVKTIGNYCAGFQWVEYLVNIVFSCDNLYKEIHLAMHIIHIVSVILCVLCAWDSVLPLQSAKYTVYPSLVQLCSRVQYLPFMSCQRIAM